MGRIAIGRTVAATLVTGLCLALCGCHDCNDCDKTSCGGSDRGWHVVSVTTTRVDGSEIDRTADRIPTSTSSAENVAYTPQRVDAIVEMTNGDTFMPASVIIRPGQTVEWRDTSRKDHTVTLDPDRVMKRENVSMPTGAKPFDSGKLHPGDNWRYTFTTPGTYTYVCTIHEDHGMRGTIVVEEPAK